MTCCTSPWPGKAAARRDWLHRVIAELADAHELSVALGLPGLAWRIASARDDARALLART